MKIRINRLLNLVSLIALTFITSCTKETSDVNQNENFTIRGKWEVNYNSYLNGVEENTLVGDVWEFTDEFVRLYYESDGINSYKFYSNGQVIGEYVLWLEDKSWIYGENPYHLKLVAKLEHGSEDYYSPQFWFLSNSGGELELRARNGTSHYETVLVKLKKK